ncbi:DUF2931 family protein [Marinobacter lipolyticus]|uniref:DUF2931 family protein n=1 Tax=Marinobacter lipolyticus TaxID=209639 RepID=UPI003A934975
MYAQKIKLAISALGLCALLSGCAATSKDEYWQVAIGAPEHYPVWVTGMHLEKSGERSWRQPVGSVGCCWKGPFGPRGKGAQADPFPELIFLTWFSFAEQKYFAKLIKLSPDILEQMREKATVYTSEGSFEDARHTLIFGLAPGGTVVGWILNQRGNEIEVMRMQASEIDGDPEDFRVGTEEYLKEHGAYLKEYGLQLNRW